VNPQTASLEALRDIHLPDAVGFWPLAPGWWALAALVAAAALGAVLVRRHRRHRKLRWQRACIEELEAVALAFETTADETALAAGLSVLLRRVALARGGESVAALHGEPWLRYWAAAEDGQEDADTARALREITETSYRGAAPSEARPATWIPSVRARLREVA
jgi:hypothetical protein